MIAEAAKAQNRDSKGRFAREDVPQARRRRKKATAAAATRTVTMHRTGRRGMAITVTEENALGVGYDVTRPSDRTRRQRTYQVNAGADRHQEKRTLDKLRETSRDLDRNSCLIHGMLDRFIDNVLGDHFTFKPDTDDDAWNDAALEWMIEKQGPQTDVRGLFDWHEIMSLTLRALCTDGDNFLLHVTGGLLQMVEAQQVANPSDKRRDPNVINGIEMNSAGRPRAIWVGEQSYGGNLRASTDPNVRKIGVENLIWPAYRTRYTQTRGVPMISAALGHFDRLDEYLDAEATAAAIDACVALLITGASDNFEDTSDDIYEQDGVDGEGNATTETLQQMQPGMIARLSPGEKVESFGAKRPGTQFETYLRTSIRILGAEMGMPLELVLLDFSDGNFSSQKAAMLQAYRRFRVWQQWLVRNVATPLYRRWIGQAMASGDLTANSQAGKVRWFPPQWAWVQPEKQIAALREAIRLGVETVENEVNRRGRTLKDQNRERSAEIKAMEADGIPSSGMAGVVVPNGPNAYAINKQTELPEPGGDNNADAEN